MLTPRTYVHRLTSHLALLCALSALASTAAAGQSETRGLLGVPAPGYPKPAASDEPVMRFTSRGDSIAWTRERDRAHRAGGSRLIVSVRERRFWWVEGGEVKRSAAVAVGKGTRLSDGSRVWNFQTPRGVRRVIAKASNPVWIPPDWHYVELARDSALALAYLRRGAEVQLRDGGRLFVRGDRIIYRHANGTQEELPAAEEVIFNRTLYVPPHDTANRRVPGELGAYKLEIGDGYMLHGTPDRDSIGKAATHGCLRLADEDIEYLYRHVPVGTPVYIY